MYTAIIALHILVSIFLVVVVLLQAGKGASIGATFGGASSQTLFGSAGPATFLNKITAGCAIIFMATSLYLTYMAVQKTKATVMKDIPAVQREVKPASEPAVQPDTAAPETATK